MVRNIDTNVHDQSSAFRLRFALLRFSAVSVAVRVAVRVICPNSNFSVSGQKISGNYGNSTNSRIVQFRLKYGFGQFFV